MTNDTVVIKELSDAYDDMPYISYPFSQTHPDFLKAVCSLFDFTTPSVASANILEIGCAFGGNCIPLAQQYPNAQVLGLDLSAKQIAVGQQAVKTAGLGNIILKQQDITEYHPPQKEFDYIICHGVFSWVPDIVKSAILRVISEGLSDNGVAIVSYNTYPGWKFREIYRDVMRYRSQGVGNVREKIGYGLGMLDFLKENIIPNSPSGAAIEHYYEGIRGANHAYLAHEDFEEVNEPCYFHEFMEKAADNGLSFVAEADFQNHFQAPVSNMSDEALAALKREAGGDIVKLEQLKDYLSNRQFRQTILTHENNRQSVTSGKEELSYDLLSKLHIQGSFAKIETTDSDTIQWQASNGNAQSTFADLPVTQFIFTTLNQQQGQTINVGALWQAAEGAEETIEKSDFFSTIWALISKRVVKIRASSVRWSVKNNDKPVMHKSQRDLFVWLKNNPDTLGLANVFHERLHTDVVGDHLIPLIDGHHTRSALMKHLVELALSGVIDFSDASEQKISDEMGLAAAAEEHTERLLNNLQQHGFLH